MKGFSRKETLAYYDQIMQKAWQEVKQAATPEVKAQVYEEVMDWTTLDRKYEDHTREVFSGPVLYPTPLPGGGVKIRPHQDLLLHL